ncbi:tRNA (guanosine(37)-N1)-methyltransferase TrmD [uncultured Pyramidobacter sp.]|uniref:tRNA (guanosine(37)-N1)-methyltransferase TrmD n=1 Tax=uncultured Pyramidobacter sp. TaxID=1623495 RepID=UPI00258C5F64|nr:tRNA (guanosine(37)-N1)-methyltransferase TrmD [uncultured Pyramidobacter sp.]
MKVTVVTAFPEFLDSFARTSIVGRAVEKGLIGVTVVDLRDFAQGNYRQIDDYSFGGKGGMTLMPEVLERALRSVRGERTKVLFPTPAGAVLTQDLVEALAREEHLAIFCGHYEGLDERFVEKYVDLEYSIGDYVLTGGEIPAMTLIDALSRLVPGVVGKERSVTGDSFYDGMLDTPHFTRPAVWQGMEVPAELTSGNDAQIEKWRKRAAAGRTLSRRPDLLSRANVMDYLEDEVYLGLSVDPNAPGLAADLAQIALAAKAYGLARVIAAPQNREDFDALRARMSEVPEIKCVPSVSRMTEWAERKEHAPLLTVVAEIPSGLPWMEAKRQMVETSGPVLLLFGAAPRRGHVIAIRPQETTGGELPRTALISATLDRFFGSR